jgi:O-antigen/teichoic acid export membrane protein
MTLARLLLAASAAVTYIFLPVAARLTGQGDIQGIRTAYVTTARWVLMFTVPMFFVFALLPSDSLGVVFGANYTTGAEALALVTVGALISVAFGPVNVTLAGMGTVRPLLVATAASAVSNVVLSFALIPKYGLLGAAIAWSVARVPYPATAALSLQLTSQINPLRRSFVLPLVVSLAVGIPLFLYVGIIPHPEWVVFPLYFVGIAIFLGALLATRSLETGDLVIVRILEGLVGKPLPSLERFMIRFTSDPQPPLTSTGGVLGRP